MGLPEKRDAGQDHKTGAGSRSSWDSGFTPIDYSVPSNKVRAANFTYDGTSASVPALDGQTMLASTAAGTFTPTSDSEVSVGNFEIEGTFLCTGDVQNYDQRGVDWFQQVQTWSFKDSWRTA